MNEQEEVDKSSLEFQVPAPISKMMANAFDEYHKEREKISREYFQLLMLIKDKSDPYAK